MSLLMVLTLVIFCASYREAFGTLTVGRLIESNGAGLASRRTCAYLGSMSYLARFSPVRAYKDLRFFLSQRQPYELGFLVLAMLVTGFLVFAFAKDSYVEREYRRNIVYVEQWPADRTDAQIRAQQKIDKVIKDKRIAEQKAADEERRAEFKRLDDRLKAVGI